MKTRPNHEKNSISSEASSFAPFQSLEVVPVALAAAVGEHLTVAGLAVVEVSLLKASARTLLMKKEGVLVFTFKSFVIREVIFVEFV